MTPERRQRLHDIFTELAPDWDDISKSFLIREGECIPDARAKKLLTKGTPFTDGKDSLGHDNDPDSIHRLHIIRADGTQTPFAYCYTRQQKNLAAFRANILFAANLPAKPPHNLNREHPAYALWKQSVERLARLAKVVADFPTNDEESDYAQTVLIAAMREDAKRGKKQLVDAKKGGDAKKKPVQAILPKLQEAHDKYMAKGFSHSRACELVAKKFRGGIGKEYLRKVLKRKPPK